MHSQFYLMDGPRPRKDHEEVGTHARSLFTTMREWFPSRTRAALFTSSFPNLPILLHVIRYSAYITLICFCQKFYVVAVPYWRIPMWVWMTLFFYSEILKQGNKMVIRSFPLRMLEVLKTWSLTIVSHDALERKITHLYLRCKSSRDPQLQDAKANIAAALKASLSGVEPMMQKIRNQIRHVDAEILAAVRQQLVKFWWVDDAELGLGMREIELESRLCAWFGSISLCNGKQDWTMVREGSMSNDLDRILFLIAILTNGPRGIGQFLSNPLPKRGSFNSCMGNINVCFTQQDVFDQQDLYQPIYGFITLRQLNRLWLGVSMGKGDSNSGTKAKEDLAAATEAIKELMHKIREIKVKAEQSEAMVQEICRDIKKLDFAKKHITTTVTALHRLAMLGPLVDHQSISGIQHFLLPYPLVLEDGVGYPLL
eukprot:Gb_31033 [translate_table: standard]